MAITEQQIFEAADTIAEGGETPTLAAIRERIGGSYTTISPVLRQWKARRQATAEPADEPIPDAVAQQIEAAGREIWKAAQATAAERLTAEHEALESQRTAMAAEQAEAVELADNLAAQVDSLKARAGDAEDESQRLRGELQAMGEDFRRHQSESQAAVGKTESERDQARQSLVDYKEQADARNKELRELMDAAESRRERDAEQARRDLTEQKEATEAAEKRSQESESRATLTTQREQAAQARLESAGRELEAAKEQARADRAAAKQAETEAAELRGRVAELEKTQQRQAKARGKGKAADAQR